ncbi:MFS transporter [Gilliamella sp. B14384H2]|uniref:MFS transporter n=1 Tax=unclassified Gilliamella TaxID=2685620 RepID=UPI0018DEC122|nr:MULTISPECIES: MFS transporter [unclassified Gilliamella]MBI0037143.1 MFS transporter [Gilliamella sp. B14384G10]MBI0039204.1 MFS transporter [Gilliamella sp. B14384G7]MBI0051137.1 MFS transporter [Gilliamella sp. B14384G13]MBI0053430.1 MFS transporter [Gilliamella sp. B14384H2]
MKQSLDLTISERKLVFAMTLSSILPLLDSSIVNVILPAISNDINASYAYIQWAVTIYMLACAAGILLSPYMHENFGLKKAWIGSIFVFLISSILVGFSYNLVSLILFRCLQGFGAGILIPITQSIIATHFAKQRLKPVMALIAIPSVFAPALGPIFGAILSEQLNWRIAFFINIPLALLAFFFGRTTIPETKTSKYNMNIYVFMTFLIALILFFISIKNITTEHFFGTSNIIMLVFAIGLMMVSFITNNKSDNKLIDLSAFNCYQYSLAIIMGFLTSLIFFGFMIFFPLIQAINNNISITYIGLLLALQGVGAWLARKFIYKSLSEINSFLIIGIGLIISAISILIIQVGGNASEIIGFTVRGSGLGVATIAVLSSPFEFCEKNQIKDTSAITRVIQQIGGAFGSVLSGILINLTLDQIISVNCAYQTMFFLSLIFGIIAVIAYIFSYRVNTKS